MRVLIASSNQGKLRDFRGAAASAGVQIELIPGFSAVPQPAEDGLTFEDNAVLKAVYYSRQVPGEVVLADDSGLAVDALNGAPGVHSARYAALLAGSAGNSSTAENNARLWREMKDVPDERRSARFVCVIAAARDGKLLATFCGEAAGRILHQPRGGGGFGYDPYFFFPSLGKTFAELTPEEKATVSHRGAAFRNFLEWCARSHESPPMSS